MERARFTNATTGSARLAWRVANLAPTHAEIDIFDVIGDDWFGTGAKNFVEELRGIDAETITVNINSPGGIVDDALAIYDAILQHPAEVTARIIVAASAASFVAQAADKRVITKNGKVFIHDGQGFGLGNASDFRRLAELLDEESNNIAAIYSERAGGTPEEWRARMLANDGIGTSYRGKEAVDIGLADEVAEAPVRNAAPPMRVAAQEPAPPEPVDIPLDLIPPAANGYKPPLPSDFTRLVAANMPASKEASNGN